MEAIGGRLALTVSSTPGKHDETGSLVVPDGKDTCAAVGAGYSSELCGVMTQSTDDPPDLGLVLPKMVLQSMIQEDKVDEIMASCKGLAMIEEALPDSSVGHVPSELTAPCGPHSLKVPEYDSSPSLLDELLNNFSCTAPLSLLDAPIHMQVEGDSTCVGRRSGRLDKKNKNCNIPVAKRAEYRLAGTFGDLPKDTMSKKGTEEDVQEKMEPYLRSCKKPITPTAMQAVRELVQVNG